MIRRVVVALAYLAAIGVAVLLVIWLGQRRPVIAAIERRLPPRSVDTG